MCILCYIASFWCLHPYIVSLALSIPISRLILPLRQNSFRESIRCTIHVYTLLYRLISVSPSPYRFSSTLYPYLSTYLAFATKFFRVCVCVYIGTKYLRKRYVKFVRKSFISFATDGTQTSTQSSKMLAGKIDVHNLQTH